MKYYGHIMDSTYLPQNHSQVHIKPTFRTCNSDLTQERVNNLLLDIKKLQLKKKNILFYSN